MINTMHAPMFPEPEATGGGDAAQTQETGQQAGKEPQEAKEYSFDISDEQMPESEEQKPESEPKTEEQSEYKLELGELPSEAAPYIAMFTEEAKAAGLEAGKASAFVKAFTGRMQALEKEIDEKERAESVEALKKTWGQAFETNYKKTQGFMQKLFAKAGLSADERKFFSNPTGFLLMNKIMGAMGNRSFVSGEATTPAKSKQERINDLIEEHVRIRNSDNPDLSKLKAIRHQINEIAGIRLYAE